MSKIWNVWKMNLGELLWSLAAMLGGTVFGMIIMSVVVIMSKENYMVIGSFIALIIWIMVYVICGVIGFESSFSLAVAMGRTRKEFIICRYIVQVINVWIGLSVLYILNLAETMFYRIFFKGITCEGNIFEILVNIQFFIGAGIALPVIFIFLGMLLVKFQKKAFWGIWVVWMAGSLMLSNITRIRESGGIWEKAIQIFEHMRSFVVGIGEYGQLAMVVIVSLILGSITWAALKKQAVSQI